ncbi:MAG TPA: ATP-dependent zinc protease [Phycisphaerales bacterium]|nr:ATP-dependent zinc protease [Phycisphaerales bacterium]HCD31471.1 ATP-dependent zinc protease [Phycisphaerales bacterium]|tara:strand:- start:562 stop:1026 length:465 start_codon:yes stop_codon:yes gene_type:complete
MAKRPAKPKPVIGWREWVHLPELGDLVVKAKVDTGARSSALHAHKLKHFTDEQGVEKVSFEIWPFQDSHAKASTFTLPVHESRWIKSSNGHQAYRPVVIVNITLMDQTWPIELTLTNRDEMGFRMLLGRQAIRRKMLVDAGKSFLAGIPDDLPG